MLQVVELSANTTHLSPFVQIEPLQGDTSTYEKLKLNKRKKKPAKNPESKIPQKIPKANITLR